jgi:hypothetical protein
MCEHNLVVSHPPPPQEKNRKRSSLTLRLST